MPESSKALHIDTDEISRLDQKHLLTKSYHFSIVTNVLIAILGITIFIVPWGYLQSGILGGSIIIIFVAVAAFCTVVFIITLQQHYFNRTGEIADYAEIVSLSIGPFASNIVAMCTIISCLGACVSYLIFIGRVFSQLFGVSYFISLAISTPFLIAVSWIQSYQALSRYAASGIILVSIALVLILFDNQSEKSLFQLISTAPLFGNRHSIVTFTGPATFLFTVHYCVAALHGEILHELRDTSSEHQSLMHLESSFASSSISRITPRSTSATSPIVVHQQQQHSSDHLKIDTLQSIIKSLGVAFIISAMLVMFHGITAMVIYNESSLRLHR